MDRFDRLIVEEIPRLRRYARALTGDSARADDLVQDCLERAMRRRHLWMAARAMRPWLFTIMHNVFVNAARRLRSEPRSVPLDESGAAGAHEPDHEGDLGIRDLDAALASLPEEQREVVLLVGLEQMTYREAAKVLGVPMGTVMSRLSRGREHLRELLGARAGHGLRRVK